MAGLLWAASRRRDGANSLDFERMPIQFIAALGDPAARSGQGAESWGLWTKDPGPRGVRFWRFDQVHAAGGVAPAGWRFDPADWWLDENGIVMEKPVFPLPSGRYVVTGERETRANLTVHPADKNGVQAWELDGEARLHDVTHLPCRSARYTPASSGGNCSPDRAPKSEFFVPPNSPMPDIEGCQRQDYRVLFIVGVPKDD